MKKNLAGKLKLNVETIKHLQHDQLEGVVGGGASQVTCQAGATACVGNTKPGRCTSVGGDFCD